jgi:hypothetical protein
VKFWRRYNARWRRWMNSWVERAKEAEVGGRGMSPHCQEDAECIKCASLQ